MRRWRPRSRRRSPPGRATLDNVRAVLVSVDGETRIAHYRHGFTEGDHGHVFSVTKSVVRILIGIAIADGLIAGVDQPLAELLPGHRGAMSAETAEVTLRHLMTMSGGFDNYLRESVEGGGGALWRLCRSAAGAPAVPAGDGVLVLRSQCSPGGGGARDCPEPGPWRPAPHDPPLRPGEAVRSAGHLDPPSVLPPGPRSVCAGVRPRPGSDGEPTLTASGSACSVCG